MKLRRIIALILALVLLLGLVAGAISVSAEELETAQKEAWEDNLLVDDPISVFAIDKEYILSVTFLDTLEDVPKIHWNMGKNHLEDVQAWVEWQPEGGNVYFAAEGGINGKDSAEALFKGLSGLKEVKFNGAYHTEQAESLAEMFRGLFPPGNRGCRKSEDRQRRELLLHVYQVPQAEGAGPELLEHRKGDQYGPHV